MTPPIINGLLLKDANDTPQARAVTPYLDESGNPVTVNTPGNPQIQIDLVRDLDTQALIGTPADLAGAATLIGQLKAVVAALSGTHTIGAVTQAGGPWTTADANGAAFGGVAQIPLGSPFGAGRSVAFVCTVAGNVDLIFADGSTWLSYPIQASPGAVQTLPYALTQIGQSASSPATLTAWNLK